MNKKLHFLLFCFSLIVIIYLCREKLIEPFGNQIVIHPDNASFDSQETTFSVLTYDSDLGSGVTQVSTCSDDSSWRNGDKTCRDYSLDGTNCEDIGSDGRLAFDACKVACDNCNTYTEVKRRLPSPIEDTDEPSYAQFEGSMSSGDIGSDIGGPDYREIIGKLDDLSGKIDLIEVSSGSTEDGGDTVDATCVEKENADKEACAAVTDLSTSNDCEEVMTDDGTTACTYTNVSLDTVIKCNEIICDIGTELIDNAGGITIGNSYDPQILCCKSIASEGDRQTCANVECTGDTPERRTFSQGSPTFSDLTDDLKQYICCTTSGSGTPGSGTSEITQTNTCASVDCNTTGYVAKKDQTLAAGIGATVDNCCDKTGYCSGNLEPNNNIDCMWPFHYNIDEKDKQVGQNFGECCENRWWWRLIIFVIILLIMLYKTVPYIDKPSYKVYLVASLISSCLLLITDSIPRFIIWHNTSKWTGYGDEFMGMDGGVKDFVVWLLVIVCIIAIVVAYILEISSSN